jgi:hypothetical protein
MSLHTLNCTCFSGALDVASKQLDAMLDQARHKHHQHRTKFKEAIDYLDQIFEDLKKECEPVSPKLSIDYCDLFRTHQQKQALNNSNSKAIN